MTFSRFIVGILSVALGLVMLKYKEQVRDFLGRIEMAEKFFGTGGTWDLVTLLGLLIPILGIMWMFGSLQSFIVNVFGRFF
jgi:hypothetical protein